jgi:hypothetical protein
MPPAIRSSFLALTLMLLGVSARASAQPDSWVDARFYVTSPGYYTATRADVAASFRDVLRWGSRVKLHYGYGGQWLQGSTCPGCTFAWYEIGEVEATSTAPYTWTAWIDHALHERSHAYWIDKLQFVWEIILPGGYVYYERGGPSSRGYYEADMAGPGTVQTIDRDDATYQRLPLRGVDAN